MLYRLTWNGCAVHMRGPAGGPVARAERYLALEAEALPATAAEPPETPLALDVVEADGGSRLRSPFGETDEIDSADGTYLVLESLAFAFALASPRLTVHAAGLVIDGGAVVCFGRPYAGKSRLAYAAWRRGLDVLGDDRVCLDAASARASAFPKCLKLRLNGAAPPAQAAAAIASDAAFVGRLADDRRLVLSRRQPGFVGYDATLALRAMVWLEPARGGRSRLDTMAVAEALDVALAHARLARFTPMHLVRLIRASAPHGRLPRLTLAPRDVERGLAMLESL